MGGLAGVCLSYTLSYRGDSYSLPCGKYLAKSLSRRHFKQGFQTHLSRVEQGHQFSLYQSSWQRWNRWCAGRGIDPFSCHVREFWDFLADLYEEGLEHRTVNSMRSAASTTHCHVEGVPIGQHPLVIRLLK